MQNLFMYNFRLFILRFLIPTVGITLIISLIIGYLFERYIILGTINDDAGKMNLHNRISFILSV